MNLQHFTWRPLQGREIFGLHLSRKKGNIKVIRELKAGFTFLVVVPQHIFLQDSKNPCSPNNVEVIVYYAAFEMSPFAWHAGKIYLVN